MLKSIQVESFITRVDEELLKTKQIIKDNNLESIYKHIDTNLREYDLVLGGYAPHSINVIAARTSVGKTNFLLNVARKVIEHDTTKKILYIDLEGQKRSNIDRLIAMSTKSNYLEEIKGNKYITDIDRRNSRLITLIDIAIERYSNCITYVNKSGLTLEDIWKIVGAYRSSDIVMIDHLQKIKYSGGNRYERIANVCEDLRILAENIGGAPLLIACQINRSGKKDGDLTHLKGAGDIEENADTVTLLQRAMNEETGELLNGIEFDIQKNRHGKTGKGGLLYVPEFCLIDNLTVRPTAHG